MNLKTLQQAPQDNPLPSKELLVPIHKWGKGKGKGKGGIGTRVMNYILTASICLCPKDPGYLLTADR